MKSQSSGAARARPYVSRDEEAGFSMAFRLCPFVMTVHSFPDLKVLDVNEAYERKTGYRRDEVVGRTAYETGLWADHEAMNRILRRLADEGRVYNVELNFRNKVGEDFKGLASSEVFDSPEGRRILSILEDISIRKRAEEALRLSETKFQRVFQEAGVGMVIATALDAPFIAANPTFCEMFGYSEEELFDKSPQSVIHPDDFQRLEQVLIQAVENGRKVYRVEARHLHKNGDTVWVEITASVIRNHDGTLQYQVVQVVDITGRKEAEKAVASLSARLIQAQEDERRHFAREIHDDIAQRLAVFIMDLEKLGRGFDLADSRRTEIQQLVSSATSLSEDLHSLSHRLHSSKLEYLGLVSAIDNLRAECEKEGLELNFTHHDVPTPLPWKVSVNLFRILQEGLSNAKKYSGVRKFDVQLNGFPGEISLSFHDSGVGFDAEKAKWKGGLGLVSMEERVKLLGGTVSITSGPTSGTTVSVRIPIRE